MSIESTSAQRVLNSLLISERRESPIIILHNDILRQIFYQFLGWGNRDCRSTALTCRSWRKIINEHPAVRLIYLLKKMKIDPSFQPAKLDIISAYCPLSKQDIERIERMNIEIPLRRLLFRNLDLLMAKELKTHIMAMGSRRGKDLAIALFTQDLEVKKNSLNYIKVLVLLEKDPVHWSKAEVDDINWKNLQNGQILDIEKTLQPEGSSLSLIEKLKAKFSRIPSDFDNEEFLLALFRLCGQSGFKQHQLSNDPNTHHVVQLITRRSEDLVLKIVSQSPHVLRFLPEFKANIKVVLAAVQRDGRALEFASEGLQDDNTIVEAAVTQDGRALRFASAEQKDNERMVLLAVKQNGFALQYVSAALRANEKVVLVAAQQIVDALHYASPALSKTAEMILTAGQQETRRCCVLSFAPDELKANKEIVLAAVRKKSSALQYASEELRADKEVVLAAIQNNGQALEYASKELRADKEVVLAAVQKHVWALNYASKELRADKEVVLAAVQKGYGGILRFASEELLRDREFILAAVQKGSIDFECASEEFRADKEVVLAAVQEDDRALRYASEELRADKEVVLAAVRKGGRTLEYASKELRADKQVVLAAVQKDGWALRYASTELKADQEIVMAAARVNIHSLKEGSPLVDEAVFSALFQYDSRAFEYASTELRSNDKIVLAAMHENMLAWQFAYPELTGEARKEKFLACLSQLKSFSLVDEEGSNLEKYASAWVKP